MFSEDAASIAAIALFFFFSLRRDIA